MKPRSGTRNACYYWSITTSRPCPLREERDRFILNPIYPQTYTHLCMYLSPATVTKHDFAPSPALLQYRVDHPKLLHMLVYHLSLQQ